MFSRRVDAVGPVSFDRGQAPPLRAVLAGTADSVDARIVHDCASFLNEVRRRRKPVTTRWPSKRPCSAHNNNDGLLQLAEDAADPDGSNAAAWKLLPSDDHVPLVDIHATGCEFVAEQVQRSYAGL